MRAIKRNLALGVACAALVLSVGLGWVFPDPRIALAGAIGLFYVLARLIAALRRREPARGPAAVRAATTARPPDQPARGSAGAEDTMALIETMLGQNRFALLLRPQIAARLETRQFQRALTALEEKMALVPDGEVVLGASEDPPSDEPRDEDEGEFDVPRGRTVRVEHFFLDRYPVTNRQFYEFVASGGYQQVSLWEPSILPAVLDFVDRTGEPGPRFWRHGCYEPQFADHPVVGVNWYEAAAYARWAGKRLPTDAEWVKAASWPASQEANARSQRRYPWGDTMDHGKTNLWSSGLGATVPVDRHGDGMSVGGVYQLVGNVWEWMLGNFNPPEPPDGRWIVEVPMKSIRGGAFNTYFDHQATCQFQSGDAAMARKSNIGFRCAVGVCDLVLARPAEEPETQETAAPMEVLA
jgi:iron(II)-dependent oxidoreductase